MFRILFLVVFLGIATAFPIEENETEQVKNLVERHVKRAVKVDFDAYVRRWVLNKGRSFNRVVSWWDLYGKHEHLATRPQYSDYKITVSTESLRYGRIQQSLDQPQQAYSKWYCNSQKNQVLRTTISREITRAASYSWTTSVGLKIGTSITVSASVPGVMEVGSTISTELNMATSITKTKEDTEKFSMNYELVVEPQTAVRADWIITEREMVIPYEADIHIEGYVSVWYSDRYDGHHLWFYPMWMLAGEQFRPNGNGLVYTATGVFRGIKGIDSAIRTEEHPVAQGKCYGSSSFYAAATKVKQEKLPLEVEVLSSKTLEE